MGRIDNRRAVFVVVAFTDKSDDAGRLTDLACTDVTPGLGPWAVSGTSCFDT